MKNEYQMKNEKRKVNKVKNSIVLTLLIFTFSFFFCLSCNNIIEPPEIHTPVSGYGRISVSLTEVKAEPRTVFPSTAFDKYVYTFTKVGETTGVVKVPDSDGFFTLEVGNYKVAVLAYTGDAEPYTLAASGVSEEFSVGPGYNDPVEVILTEVDTEEKGVFSYTITYPADATAAISLHRWSNWDPITLDPVIEGNGITETLQLEAGTYLLAVLISKDGLYAGISEAVHIYPKTVTEYIKEFDDEDMIADLPPLVTDYTISGIIEEPFTYDGSAKTVSITRKDNASPGEITVLYNGTADEPVDAGTYTVTFDVAAVRGWSEATGLPAGTIIINKAAGAEVDAPTATSSVTINSITINAVTAPDTEQDVEYAISTTDTAPASDWQPGTTFSDLTMGTTYYIFARSVENDNYEAGQASGSLPVTTLQTVSDNRIEYYWVNEHGSLVTTSGGATAVLEDETLTITPQGDDYDVWQWHLNGINTGQSGNTFSFSNTALGEYIVGLIVEKGGKFYNTNIPITVAVPYTVTFNANSGSGTAPAAQTIPASSSVTLPDGDGLTRTGYIFSGWSTAANAGTNYSAGASYTPTDNVTLYARWLTAYTVTFNINSGNGTAPTAQTVAAGSSVTLPDGDELTRTGYTFGGWNTTSSGTGTNYNAGASYTPTGNVTLYARWIVTYTVTFNANNGIGTTPTAQTVATGSSITLPDGDELTRTGYTFGGWNTAANGTGTNYSAGATYTPTSNVTLYASWGITLTAGIWADGSITSTASTVWYSFNVVSGTTYYVWWNDSYRGNGTKTLDVRVSASYSNGSGIFTGIDSGWEAPPQSFTASSNGTVRIRVEPYSSDSTGTFAVAYRANNSTRP